MALLAQPRHLTRTHGWAVPIHSAPCTSLHIRMHVHALLHEEDEQADPLDHALLCFHEEWRIAQLVDSPANKLRIKVGAFVSCRSPLLIGHSDNECPTTRIRKADGIACELAQ